MTDPKAIHKYIMKKKFWFLGLNVHAIENFAPRQARRSALIQ